MKKFFPILIVFLILFCPLFAIGSQNEKNSSGVILLPKFYFKEQVTPTKDKIATVCVDEGLKSEIVYRGIDFKPCDYSGEPCYDLKMSCDSGFKPIFAVNGLDFKPNLIITEYVFEHPHSEYLTNNSLKITLNSNNYIISSKTDCDGDLDKSERCQSTVFLEKDGVIQRILVYKLFNSFRVGGGLPRVIWAGDIDNDGNLDLLIDHQIYDSSNELTLFLSSKAGANELVKPVLKNKYNWD